MSGTMPVVTIDLTSLNPEQQQAVCHTGSHLLVVAGPGSGKTRVLTHRVAWLLDQGVSSRHILAVTFTNKAAGEIRERLSSLTGETAAGSMWAGTFHSLCARLLRIEHAAANLPRSFQIMDTDDTERLVTTIVKERGLATDTSTAKQLAKELREQISLRKNTLGQSTSWHPNSAMIDHIKGEYTSRLREMNALDFDDLLLETLNVLSTDTDAAQRWRSRFSHVLVDEFQDTNAVQLALVKAFSTQGLVTAVGDAAQAIYSWRGADHTVIERFSHEFNPSTVILLGQNYRSTPQIVGVCQDILDHDTDASYRLDLSTSNNHGDKVVVRTCDDDRDEASWIVSKLGNTGFGLSDHAILVRTASQTRSLEEELLSRRVPYVVVGGQRFYERAEVKDALAHLRTAVFDTDSIAFGRAALTPRCGIGEKTIAAVSSESRTSGSIQLALRSGSSRTGSALERFADHLLSVKTAAETGPAAAVREVLSGGLLAHWSAQQGGDGRAENLEQLISAAAAFSKGRTADGRVVAELSGFEATVAFIEYVALVSAADEGTAQGVQILTIHAAKGREFPVVFVAGLEQELLPHIRSINSDSSLREERRLFYVACSRAEKKLFISWARSRLMFGKPKQQQRSDFLTDLLNARASKGGTHIVTEDSPRRKAPWTDNHRSRPVGAGRWSESHTAYTTPRPPVAPRNVTAPGPRLIADQLEVGTLVKHAVFGPGKVRAVKGDSVDVMFADKSRTLAISMAPLEIVNH